MSVYAPTATIICPCACAAQPSAALERVGSAQQGVWSLGLEDVGTAGFV